MRLFDQAQKYHDLGFSIVPISLYNDPNNSNKVKKIPMREWKAFQNERVTKTTLMTKWAPLFENKPGRGVAILTGEISDLMVVDMDDKAAIKIVKAAIPKDFKTKTVQTGRGGYHLYFKYRSGLKSTAGLGNTGLDIRTDGGLVVAPPSLFPENWGTEYKFTNDIEPAQIPDKLFELLKDLINKYEPQSGGTRDNSGKKNWFLESLKGVGEGQRTTILLRLCGNLKRLNIEQETAWQIIKGWNQLNKPPEDTGELEKQFKSFWKNVIKKEDTEIFKKINDKYSVISSGNNTRIMYEDQWGELHFFPRHDFQLRFENQRVPQGNKTISIANLWLEWPERKTYEKCVFDPSEKMENCYNLWKGFPVTGKKGKWNLFRDHIEHNIAKENTDWILKWMARIVQDPGGDRPGTTLVLRGKQGTGKGVFANNFGKLFGNHYTIVNDMTHVTGRFNKDLVNTLLLYIDEATWGGDVTTAGKLKNLITEPKRRVESKGIDAIYVDNHLSLIISSNNQWVVPSGPMERRFLVMDVDEKHIQDRVYFKAMIDQLKNGGYEAMMYDLQNLEYDLDELREIPKTSGTRDQSLKGLDFIEKFWCSRLQDGKLVDAHEFWKYRVVVDKLYQQYMHYCSERNFNRKIEAKETFSKRLKRMCPLMGSKAIRKGTTVFRCYILPDLKKCRDAFDIFLTGVISDDWPEIMESHLVTDPDRHIDLPGSFRIVTV